MINQLEQEAIKNLAVCGKELRELRQFSAIDYEKAEQKYGRADGKPVVHNNDRVRETGGVNSIGSACLSCPIPELIGECTVRDSLQALAAEHRAKLELGVPASGNMNDLGVESIHDKPLGYMDDIEIEYTFDSGWRQQG